MNLTTARGYQSEDWRLGHALIAKPEDCQPFGGAGRLPG
jgi:hypothetical protein